MKDIKKSKDIKDAATASEDIKDAIKTAKEAVTAKKNKKDCARDCGTDYDRVCAHDSVDSSFKPRTFDTQCALDNHNCEMGTNKHMKAMYKSLY